ncbi:protein TIFY 10A-like [Melia azedarach]|uniref:Protein TIFY 10A-like n=1 Tax=Melia azedarach TaxID=155640 RepID=A0ACC1YYM7_MELAZ|nr:protein TIFY 10A-like [Melia azedarach]
MDFSEMLISNQRHKSSVAQTCNLLSQYLEENGRFADISGLGMTVKPEANKEDDLKNKEPISNNGRPKLSKKSSKAIPRSFPLDERQNQHFSLSFSSATLAAPSGFCCSIINLGDHNSSILKQVYFPHSTFI